jgi:hypothetical protein
VRFVINRAALQLCYVLENASSARIEPGVGELTNLRNGCANIPSRNQQTYILTATGANGTTDTKSVTYTPPEPPNEKPIEINSFTYKGPPQPIKPREKVNLCYSTRGRGTAEISPRLGTVPPSDSNCVTDQPDRTTVYTLTVTPPHGVKKSKTVTVRVKGHGIVIIERIDQEKL